MRSSTPSVTRDVLWFAGTPVNRMPHSTTGLPNGRPITSGAGSPSSAAAAPTSARAADAHVSCTYMRLTPLFTAAFGL